MAGPLSTGSPTMLRMRPSVSLPTGTVIGAPVSSTDMPRVSPSVAAMAMVRTCASPRCWATSRVSLEEYAKMSFCSTPCTSRSEEHTSELQSPYDLVCRLLLEKKKKKHKQLSTDNKS